MRRIEIFCEPDLGAATVGALRLEADGSPLTKLRPGTPTTTEAPEGSSLQVRGRWAGRSNTVAVPLVGGMPALIVSYEPHRANWVIAAAMWAFFTLYAFPATPEDGTVRLIALGAIVTAFFAVYFPTLYYRALRLYVFERAA